MSTRLKWIGLGVAGVSVAVWLALWQAQDADPTSSVDGFFDAVWREDVDAIHAAMTHPELEPVERGVLEAYFRAVNEGLGRFERMKEGVPLLEESPSGRVRILQVEGEAAFEKGTARIKLLTIGGKIPEFELHSENIHAGWQRGITDLTGFDRRSKDLLAVLVSGDVERAMHMVPYALQRRLETEQYRASLAAIQVPKASTSDFTLDRHEFLGEDPVALVLHYKSPHPLPGSEDGASMQFAVTWGFRGLTGFVDALYIPELK